MSTVTTRPRTPAGTRSPKRPGFIPTLARTMERLGCWQAVLLSGAVYAVFASVFFGTSAPFSIPTVSSSCGQPIPDLVFTSSARRVHDFLDSCGPVGREAYRNLQLADLAYPMVFAVFLASSLALSLRTLAPGRQGLLALAAVPFLAAAFDYAENACAWLALAAYPGPGPLDSLLGLASAGKSATSWFAGLLLIAVVLSLLLAHARQLWARPGRNGAATAD